MSSAVRRLLSGAMVVALAAAITGVLVVKLRDEPSSAQPRTEPRSVATLAAVPARRVGSVRAERPTTSTLPDGVVVPLRPAGTRRDGSLAVPDDIRRAGWWRGGARLGDPFGSTLLAGHVDSFTQGLGPYSALLSARPGDRVVIGSTHLTQTFAVVSLRLVPRGTLARHRWIFSARGPRRLTLVTCAGPYVPQHGGYQNLAIVTATPVSDPVVGSSP